MKDVAIKRRKNFVMKNFWESESTEEKKVECLVEFLRQQLKQWCDNNFFKYFFRGD